MLHRTKGVVFNFIKYRESSIIVKIFTEKFGMQSYVVNGVRSARGKNKIALFQPLTLLELVVYKKEGASINRISEVRCAVPYQSLPFDVSKSGIAMFLVECCVKLIQEEKESRSLFTFLHHSFLTLDHLQEGVANFHLQFLLKLTRYMGLAVNTASDLVSQIEAHLGASMISRQEQRDLDMLAMSQYGDYLGFHSGQRQKLLEFILAFYRYHFDNFKNFKSITVLHAVLH
ncbi:MAG: DNA repair protein RecO [Cytophagales bacterium]|nr:DNA repair protein RecO [Cytophagales bacterium]